MTNIEYIREKVKFHVRDVSATTEEIDDIILTVLNDIALEVKLFKKVVGFTIHKDMEVYDFRDILRMNEQVEEELQAVYIGGTPDIRIKNWLKGGEFPSPIVLKDKFLESDAQSTFIELVQISDISLKRWTHKFNFTGTADYIVTDTDWLEENDGAKMLAIVKVKPHIDELLEEDIDIVLPCIIEGSKYYFANTLQSTTDSQVANLYYQRYWYKKKELVNAFPTTVFTIRNDKETRKWL